MTSRERTFLGLSIAAFLVPNAMLIAFVVQHGANLSAYLNGWLHPLPAAQSTTDLFICFLAFTIWSVWEGRRLGMRAWWQVIPATLLVGLCFAIPLFLLFRERALRPRALRRELSSPRLPHERPQGPGRQGAA